MEAGARQVLGRALPVEGKNLDTIPESGLLGKFKEPQEARSVVRMGGEDGMD